jgi:hypothetical protein
MLFITNDMRKGLLKPLISFGIAWQKHPPAAEEKGKIVNDRDPVI